MLTLIYGGEVLVGHGTAQYQVLKDLGALNRNSVLHMHEWYRIFTAPLLHGGFTHLLLNCIALFFAGIMLEKLCGRMWFFAFFVIGALGGSLMSLAVNNEGFSVGASGAIMALFSVLFVATFRLPKGSLRIRMQSHTLRVLIPALIPSASHGGPRIDVGAHFGGFLAGLIVAIILMKIWPKGSISPPGKKFAKGVGIAGLIATIISCGCVALNQHASCSVGGDPEKMIKACSAVIEANKDEPKELASALEFRGIAYGKQKQNNLALADLNRAIELDRNPMSLLGQSTIFIVLHRYDDAIQNCNSAIRLISDDRLLRLVSPSILSLRASAYIGKGQISEAEKDINKALGIDPLNAAALNVRSHLYVLNGEYGKAIDDLNKANRSTPSDPDLFWMRGEAKIFKGTPDSAIDDLKMAVKLDPTDGYKTLWLHLARVKAGQNDQQEFQQNNAKLVADKWPQPITDFYLNKITVAEVLAKAENADTDAQRDQLCEANFYIGELYLQQGAKNDARRFLLEALDKCPVDFMERTAADIELKSTQF